MCVPFSQNRNSNRSRFYYGQARCIFIGDPFVISNIKYHRLITGFCENMFDCFFALYTAITEGPLKRSDGTPRSFK